MMTRTVLALLTALALPSSDQVPAAMPVDRDCASHAATHVLVRKDVIGKLDAADVNLPRCEAGLVKAQGDLEDARSDLLALHSAALEQRAAIAELTAQKRVLEGYVAKLEATLCPEPTISNQIVEAWDRVDGSVGIASGYALGTGMCIALAWVFNQPSFRRD